MPHSCQKLGATFIQLFLCQRTPLPSSTPCSIFTHQTTLALLNPEADGTTSIDARSGPARPGVAISPSLAVRLPQDMEAYGHSPRLWGCAGAVLTNPGPCRWHDGPKIQKSGMWSPETTSIPGISVTGSRRRLRADAPWMTPCTLTRCLSSGPNFRPACLPAQVTWWTEGPV